MASPGFMLIYILHRVRIDFLRRYLIGCHLYDDTDDPVAKFMHENAIKPDFCTPAMHEQIEQWMDGCFNHHDRCVKAGSSNMPTRLLHILEEGESLRLVETCLQKERYLALSYPWGAKIDLFKSMTATFSTSLLP